MYKHLEHVMRKELQTLEDKYRNDQEMSEGDLRRADLLLHSLKSMATYCAMVEAEEAQSYNTQYQNNNMNNSYMNNNSYMGNSYGRGRDGMGRFTSNNMNPDISGHMYPPIYPEDRRW